MSIHPSAIVHPSAKIGANVSIGPFAFIGEQVEIGDHSVVMPHTYIEFTKLGEKCQVFPNASLGMAPQHLKYKNEPTSLIVGNRVVFREGVTAHRGTPLDQGKTTIGDDCYFMALSHIAHDCKIGSSVIMANGAQLAGHVEVGDNCFVSALVGLHQFVRVGKGAIISGGAMVSLDVGPFCIAQGDRASIRGLNVVGMRRMGIDRSDMKLIKQAYKLIFYSGLALGEALESLETLGPSPFVSAIKTFYSQPKRGFTRPEEIQSADEAEKESVG